MNKFVIMTCVTGLLSASAAGCGASAAEEQRRAMGHQYKADQAAQQGQYGVACIEQRKAQEAHAKAVEKAMDEGQPIPPQPVQGAPPPQPPPP